MRQARGWARGGASPARYRVGVRAAFSVIVAVHDVEPWIGECLSSVARQVPEGTEVILVEDGSSDQSGTICDEWASRRPGWRVIHQPNAGLGAARNVGLRQASGELVAFVDGDDVLLPGYPALVRAARDSGYAVATGPVLRTDGSRSWVSALHAKAIDPLGDVADISRDPSLVFDTTAWNKVYRRDFLLRHDLTFPEGVLYEDLPLTIPAFCLAGPVAVVHEPVYSWRARSQGLSITQRRHEIDNLRDRFAAVRAVDRFLEEHQLHDLRAAHDDKVLRLDLPLYTAALPEADATYRAAYLQFCDHLVHGVSEERRRTLPPTLRLYVELAAAGRMDDLLRAVRGRRGPRPWAPDTRSGWQRVRDDLAVYGLERELGLAGWPQVLRRAPVRAVKLLLPEHRRQQLGGARARRPDAGAAAPAPGPAVSGVTSVAGTSRAAAPESPEPLRSPERQATNE